MPIESDVSARDQVHMVANGTADLMPDLFGISHQRHQVWYKQWMPTNR